MEARKWKIKFKQQIKIKKTIINIIYILTLLLIIYNIAYNLYTAITNKEYLEILGISIFSQENTLMEPEIRKNDLVIMKEIKDGNIKDNDIIAYKINGIIRINKVIKIRTDEQSGEKTYITKSNKNYHPDIEEIRVNQIIGKRKITIPLLGKMIKIMQTKTATIIVIILLLLRLNYNIYINEKIKNKYING